MNVRPPSPLPTEPSVEGARRRLASTVPQIAKSWHGRLLSGRLLAGSAFLALLCACSGGSSKTPHASITAMATSPVLTPNAVTSSPVPTPPAWPTPVSTVVPVIASAAVAVFRHYDPAQGEILDTSDLNNRRTVYSTVLRPRQRAIGIAGRELLLTEGGTLEAVSLDGVSHRALLNLGPDTYVADAALSPDGKVIYATGFGPYSLPNVPCIDRCRTDGTWLVLIDAGDGHEMARTTFTDLGLDWRLFSPPALRWRLDGRGIVLHEVTDSENPGNLAIYLRDGSLVISPRLGYVTVSPDGMLTADFAEPPLGEPDCGAGRIEIRDGLTGIALNSVEDRETILRYRSWSPNSDAVLYRMAHPSLDANGLCNGYDERTSSWCLLPVDGGAPSCGSPGEQRPADQSVYPGHSVESPCYSEVHGTWMYFYCQNSATKDLTEVTVDGVKAFDGHGSVELLGIAEPVAR